MITVKRSSLKLLSIALGFAFTAGIYINMHYGQGWDWDAPGTGKLPREIVRGFMAEAYDQGRGAAASARYFAPDAKDNAPAAADRQDGALLPHQVRSVVAEGLKVVVIHHIAAARGAPAADAIDLFETRNGRIIRRERHIAIPAPVSTPARGSARGTTHG